MTEKKKQKDKQVSQCLAKKLAKSQLQQDWDVQGQSSIM